MTSSLPAFMHSQVSFNNGFLLILISLEIIFYKVNFSVAFLLVKYDPILQHQFETNLTVKGIFSTFYFCEKVPFHNAQYSKNIFTIQRNEIKKHKIQGLLNLNFLKT